MLVRCGSCGLKSQVAGLTRIGGGIFGLLGTLWTVALSIRYLAEWASFPGFLAYFLFSYVGARMLLRLDPPELAD